MPPADFIFAGERRVRWTVELHEIGSAVHCLKETRLIGRQPAKHVSYLVGAHITHEEGVGHGRLPRRTRQRLWRASSRDSSALAEWNQDKTMDSPLQVIVHPPQSPVAAGDTVRVLIRLADAGAGGTYHLAVRGLADDWYTLEQPRVVLDPGQWAAVSLAIRPPAALGHHSGGYAVTIEARASDGTSGQGSATFPLSVAPLRGLGLDITPVQAPGATMAWEAVVVNAQEADTLVGVVVAGPPGIAARVDPSGYAWAPRDGTRRFVVHVGATGARVGAGAYDLTVSALVQGVSVAPGVTRRVRFDYRPRGARRVLSPLAALAARRGVVYAFLAALLALGLGLVAADTGVFGPSAPTAAGVPLTTFPSPTVSGAATVSAPDDPLAGLASGPPPRVVRFEARVTARGTAVVSWSVRDALLVRLDGTSVPARGEQTLALVGPRTVLLRADGDGGTVIRRLRLAPPLSRQVAAARRITPRGPTVHHIGTHQATTMAPRATATTTAVGTPTVGRRTILAAATRPPHARTVSAAPASARLAVARSPAARATASPRPPDQGAASTHAQRRVRPHASRARRHLSAATVRDALPAAATVRAHARHASPSLTLPRAHKQAPGTRATATARPHTSRVRSAPRHPTPRPTPPPTTRRARVPVARREQTQQATASPTARVISDRRRAPTPRPTVTPVAGASAALIPAPTRAIRAHVPPPPVPTRAVQARGPAAPAQRPPSTGTPLTAALTRPTKARPMVSDTTRPTATPATDRRAVPTTSGRPAPSQTPSDRGAPGTPLRAATTATSTPRVTAPDPRSTPTSAPRAPIHATTTPTNTPRPIATNTPRPIATSTPRPIATSTPRPIATSTPRVTAPDPRPTDTPPPTSTPRPTATATNSPTATATNSPTATATNSPTATATNSPTATATASPTATATASPTATATASPTATATASPTATATASPTATSTPTHGCKHDSCHPR